MTKKYPGGLLFGRPGYLLFGEIAYFMNKYKFLCKR